MKRIAVILILLIYSVASIGATIHLHYCMDEYVGWSLQHKEDNQECGKCGMQETKDGCCKDEHTQVKLDTDQQKTDHTYNFQVIDLALTQQSAIGVNLEINTESKKLRTSNKPPDISRPGLYILHCVFTI